jgi:hypothetical protein
MMKKEPVDITRLNSLTLDTESLAEACKDYIGIEYEAGKAEKYGHYNKHFQQRLRTGKSIFIKVDKVEDEQDSTGITVHATMDYRKLPFDNPEIILSAIRQKGAKRSSAGSFMLAIPISVDGKQQVTSPYAVARCVKMTIEDIDTNTGVDGVGTITLNALEIPSKTSQYTSWHRIPTATPKDSDSYHLIEPGNLYVLDPNSDDVNSERASEALSVAHTNHAIDLFEDIIDGKPTNKTFSFDQDNLDAFVGWACTQERADFPSLNDNQRAFVSSLDHELSLLQGPPGTGKTSGALAPAIAGRLLSYSKPTQCRALVTGPSNKAVDEVLEDVATVVNAYQADPDTDDQLDDVLLVRLAGEPAASIPGVEYTPGYDKTDSTFKKIRRRLMNEAPAMSSKHVVVFATASKSWSLAGKITKENDASELTEQETLSDTGNNNDSRLTKLFDMVVTDEASMMDVPQFFLSTAFYRRGGNILVCGDHRQLPPVQQHDWDAELRPTIRALAPYLSILNFCRVVRGDDNDVLEDDLMELLTVSSDNDDPLIPLHQLEITYRCHTDLAAFLQRWVYERDNLGYTSSRTASISTPTPQTDGIETVLDPDTPVVVVTYDDTTYQQSNPLEALLSEQLIHDVQLSDSVGIVTPHNAQRGLLEQQFQQDPVDNQPDIDTVERFQGGERDMIIVNGTVSDPDYIASESDFLLNLNRLNVAMSRMKKKLVVIAAESIFDHVPLDTDEYNQALLWKGLSRESGLSDESVRPMWSGPVNEFIDIPPHQVDDRVNLETKVSIYSI